MRVLAIVLTVVTLASCTTRAVPSERTYVDRGNQVFELARMAVSTLRGRVLVADRMAGMITATFPDRLEGPELVLEARLERHVDETVVSVTVHGGGREVEADVLEDLRGRFFEELDGLVRGTLPGVHLTPGAEPTPWSTPGPWAPPGRG